MSIQVSSDGAVSTEGPFPKLIVICHSHDTDEVTGHIRPLHAPNKPIEIISIAPPSDSSGSRSADKNTTAAPGFGIAHSLLELLRERTIDELQFNDEIVAFALTPRPSSSAADTYQSKKHLDEMLVVAMIEGAYSAFSKIADLGIALPPGISHMGIALEGKNETGLIPRLSATLGIGQEHLRKSYYFPIPQFFLRGSLVRKLLERLCLMQGKRDDTFAAALDLGFHALTSALGYTVREITPTPVHAPAESYLSHLAARSVSGHPQPSHPEYCQEVDGLCLDDTPILKYVAYYLPQFHSIPENDRWWGKGFTEWTNVTRAVPRFIGHHQPRLPEGQGFYDLSAPDTLRRQVAKARRYGIQGFCFYFYWFNGKTLLEQPLQTFLADKELDFPFCLCWANENWTRRWDGQEQEVLIEQSHSARDDLHFIAHIAAYLKDPRYIRVGGKPLLLVYRASLLDKPRETVARWRKWCRDNGVGDIYVAAVLSFDINDPRPFGFDAGVEFPPHQLRQLPPINRQLAMLDARFSGEILDYRETVLMSALEKYAADAPPDFPLIRGVMTGWDNDARRKGKGGVFHHASPSAYANWLRLASSATLRHNPPDLQFVFINAWNEWAEGAHLEPDQYFGHAYLAATADTLRLFSGESNIPMSPAGTSSAALHYLPPGVRPKWDAAALALARQYLDASHGPRFTVVLIVEQAISPALLDTLTALAEQSYRRFSLHVITTDAVPVAKWFDHNDIQTSQQYSVDPYAALNALAADVGETWLVLLRPGDRLLPHALLSVATRIAGSDHGRALVSDELQHPGQAEHSELVLCPPMNVRELRHRRMACGLLATRADAFVSQGGLDPAMFGAMESDYLLRLIEGAREHALLHHPEVVIWRNTEAHPDLRLDAEQAQPPLTQAVLKHLQRCATYADVVPADAAGSLHVMQRRSSSPLVSIIVPTHNQPQVLQRCIDSIFANTAYPSFEVIVVDHLNDEENACAFLSGLASIDPNRIRVTRIEAPFNYAQLNNAGAQVARGEFLLFLNDDTAALHPDWLDALVDETCDPDVAVVGARLVFPDGRLQHAGIALGMSGVADFPFQGHALDAPGPGGCLSYVRQVSAVSGACMLVRRSDFEQVSGMDEALAVGFADVDLCLRLASLGRKSLWTPRATLMHEAGLSLRQAAQDGARASALQAGFESARQTLLSRWHKSLANDPHLNPNRSLVSRQLDAQTDSILARDVVHWRAVPNVLALPADDGGSGEYRVAMPARTAHEAGAVRARQAGGYPLPILIDKLGIDTIHTQRQVDDAQLATLGQIRASLDLRIVMDFDDLLTAVPKASHHARDVWPDIERRMRTACSLSDIVTVSTEPLAEELRKYHGDVRCIPNAVDVAVWQAALSEVAPRERRNKRLRVGWAGGISHAPDLKVIEKVVQSLADEVDWVFLGMTLDTLRPYLTEFHRGVPMRDYPLKLAELDLDLAIAPLEHNRFNECKSNLRLLEYGALGIPVIASDIQPYRSGLPVTCLRNRPADWIKVIRDRIGESESLKREGVQLQEAVLSAWNNQTTLEAWRGAWGD